MTKAIVHLNDDEFNPVCRTKRRNIDATHKRKLVTCSKCRTAIPRIVLDLLDDIFNKYEVSVSADMWDEIGRAVAKAGR